MGHQSRISGQEVFVERSTQLDQTTVPARLVSPSDAITESVPATDVPQKKYNRKNPKPSEAMSESDGFHYRCPWIEKSITVHSDGNVSCGLDDPHAERSFGNVNESTVEEIFGNPEYEILREKL